MIVEEDGDEVLIRMEDVRCCRIGFDGNRPVYSSLVPRVRHGVTYLCCEVCGGSYGEASKPTKEKS